AQGGSLDTWREARRRIPTVIPATIRQAGLDYDLIDDDALAVTAPNRYRAVVVSATTMILDATAHWLHNVITAGGSVIIIDSSAQVPGAVAVEADSLADTLAEAVEPDLAISPPTPEIGFVHRRCQDAEVYVVINTGPTTRTFGVVARTSLRNFEQWDAMTGRTLRAGAATDGIELTLHPYHSTVLVLTDEPANGMSAEARPSTGSRRMPLRGPWQVAYGTEPAQPVDLPHIWEDEPGRRHYSGAATYTTGIELDAVGDRALLDFGECEIYDDRTTESGLDESSYRVPVRGPVGEVAQVRVNGSDCGLAWAPPYRLQIRHALRSGTNNIEIIVYNTAANALAADEHITNLAAESEARYGRRFRMQDLDHAMDTVRSGLLQVPTLVLEVQ
ncbi:MAG TPA: hypothetical protein VJ625_15905, partial [Propionibacteriaceae bacterium]|nr:hypothetical protein [Propionibacteriaceae bacterium]